MVGRGVDTVSREAGGIEWQTLAVIAGIYLGFAALTWHYHALPWWLVLPLAGLLLGWYGSAVHEVIHGHPTGNPLVDALLVGPCLWLWLPYSMYRDSHLAHHRNEYLTDPLKDPESFYLDGARWAALAPPQRWLLRVHNTLLGRLLLGPPLVIWRLAAAELPHLARGDAAAWRTWLVHLLACAPVLWWLGPVCGIGIVEYAVLFVWPGLSVTLLRSFAEHRAEVAVARRTGVVEAGPLMSLVFLNNNLHWLHHAMPAMAWYRLPATWRALRGQALAANGGYRYAGYGEVFRRYLLRVRQPVLHPSFAEAVPGGGDRPPGTTATV